MITRARTIHSTEALDVELGAIADRIVDRYYVTFPGEALPWDGRDHDLVVQLAGDDQDPLTLTLPAKPATTALPAGSGWLAQVLAGIALVATLALLARRRHAAGT
jgi:hypothetical protein